MNDAPTRTLVLLRHAKAEDSSTAQTDHERALSPRGRSDAAAAGEWLKEQEIAPTLVLCSTALRTRETWAAVSETSGFGGLVEHERRIYNAPVEQLLQVVQGADEDARVVALVGHSPGVPGLAATLAGEGSDADAVRTLEEGYPTCTIAVLEITGDWADLAPGSARLLAVHTARDGAEA